MMLFNFIFLKRKLEMDKDNLTGNLIQSKEYKLPMWLLLFPEGTGKLIDITLCALYS